MNFSQWFDLKNPNMTAVPVMNKQITVAFVIAAYAIMTEAATVPNHANRFAWAMRIMPQVEGYAPSFMWEALYGMQAAITDTSNGKTPPNMPADSDWQTAVNAIVTALAALG